jgi:DNA-3-methyladenine glycosylase
MKKAKIMSILHKNRLPRSFYDRDTQVVAKDLLGQYLVHIQEGVAQVGRIVEVEAYLGPHDLAAHSCKGLTSRTQVMFGPPGYAYVYLIYGMYHCMNVVTEQSGQAAAVLLRALEPIDHIHLRTKGPGLLCKAMNITKMQNNQDLMSDHFFIAKASETLPESQIIKKPRIGVDYAGEWAAKLLRFYIKDNPYVSRK